MRRTLIFISLLTCVILVCFFAGCTKDNSNNTTSTTVATCDVRGTYSGTNLSATGNASTLTYKLQDNNLATGSVTPTGAIVTFGGYRNTCDSVILSVYYANNNSYYLLQGKLSNSGATISGTFKNLTTVSDYGTFTISK